MRRIKLTQGYTAIVDDEDFETLSRHKWCVQTGTTLYAKRRESGRTVLMHRMLTGAAEGELVDHCNGNGLDNRRSNLRTCNRAQNAANSRKRAGLTSRFKGVSFHKALGYWEAYICRGKTKRHLGWFKSEEEAAAAYERAARRRFGAFANTKAVA